MVSYNGNNTCPTSYLRVDVQPTSPCIHPHTFSLHTFLYSVMHSFCITETTFACPQGTPLLIGKQKLNQCNQTAGFLNLVPESEWKHIGFFFDFWCQGVASYSGNHSCQNFYLQVDVQPPPPCIHPHNFSLPIF